MKKITTLLLIVLLIAIQVFANGESEVQPVASTPVKEEVPVSVAEPKAPEVEHVVAKKSTSTPISSSPAPVVSTALTTMSTPIYRVNLYDTVTINQQDLDEAVSYYSSQLGYQVDPEQVLTDLVNNILFSQAIDKALETKDIDVYDGEFNEYVSYQLQALASQYGISINSNEAAEDFLKKIGASYQEFANSCLTTWAQDKYIQLNGGAKLEESIPQPTDDEIQAYYKANLSRFVGDEYIKVAHIFFLFSEDKSNDYTSASDILASIKDGTYTFEKAANLYSQDTDSSVNGGIIDAWIGANDKTMKQAFGEETLKTMFKLDSGEISDVIEGTQGYHIFKGISHKDPSLLNVNDKFDPNDSYTVKDVIIQQLMVQKYQEAYLGIYNDIIEKLRAQATLTSLK